MPSPQVSRAPTGAARLKINKCVLTCRRDRPCFSKIETSPKAAGALWIMIARKMIIERRRVVGGGVEEGEDAEDVEEEGGEEVGEVDEAPNAIPSAAAWMQRPRVVDSAREGAVMRRDEEEERNPDLRPRFGEGGDEEEDDAVRYRP